ncbi:hypothetical protein [Cystobacter fuscus]|uniref:hypothetical protein n=1 Tax=Cystobacter fuscus TaxID=43 RepID=UPI0037BE5C9F
MRLKNTVQLSLPRADRVAAVWHHGSEVLTGIAIQGTLREHVERDKVSGRRAHGLPS